MPAFDWPHDAAPLPIEPLRGAIDRLTALAARHEGVLELIAPLEAEDEQSDGAPGTAGLAGGVAGDPRAYLPPVLSRIADEFGGIRVVGGDAALMIVVDERSDLGPFTILTDPVSFTPLYEGDDVAVVLAIDAQGAAGPVFAIGEDLALTLVAPDLVDYVQRFTEALDLAVTTTADETVDAELVADRMEESFFAPLFAEDPERTVALTVEAPSGVDAPADALAVADLRGAAPGARVEVMDADLPGDPLDIGIAWRADGLVVVVTGE
ncbi:hypothetical protein Bra3105_12930 [Brachybacterium halotolerans subsp. kimchii]|uniref:hypothetical protein n=1 Tax=Brachybacterium halotolerans TaxID=2795215 RepID=UPI001E4FE199|nr:hypothetical protein [Brachybacterium halotolerans]UEJ81741.1 hypothetical protein Bra3105_12930 [Brachybacterium halotolerans subsp. kimchii]